MSTNRTPTTFGRFVPSDYAHAPGGADYVRIFGGFRPRGHHAVTHDVLIHADESVTVEINGTEVSDL